MAKKRKISATEKKLRAELRADQNRLKKLSKEVEKNWKFGKNDAGTLALKLNARINEKKKKLARFGYKGAREIDWEKRAEKIKADEKFNFGNSWDKKDAEAQIFKVIKPKTINGKSLQTDLNGAIAEFNQFYPRMESKYSLMGKITVGGDLILYLSKSEKKENK